MAFILMMSALVWDVPDKTGKVKDDQNDYNDQNDPTAADIKIIHLDKLFRFKSQILTSEKQNPD